MAHTAPDAPLVLHRTRIGKGAMKKFVFLSPKPYGYSRQKATVLCECVYGMQKVTSYDMLRS